MPKARPTWEQDPRLQRILALVAAIAVEPGITPEALGQEVATRAGRPWSSATLRRDVRLLKNWGLLTEGPQRKGYRLAGVHLSWGEARQAAEALAALHQVLPLPTPPWHKFLLSPLGEESGASPLAFRGSATPALDPQLVGVLVEAARKGATLSLSSKQGQAPWEGPGIPLQLEWAFQGPWLWVENPLGVGPRLHRIALGELLSALPTRQPHRGRKRQQQALSALVGWQAGPLGSGRP